MSLPASKPTRNADLHHAQSLGRQRKAATASPPEQAEAIAAIIHKRIVDGQTPPDLDRYNLTDATWSELLAILDGDELTLVADACKVDDIDEGDDEPSLEEWTVVLEDDAPLIPEPAPQHTPPVAHGWRDHETPVVHSVTWTDGSGLNHMHCVRGDTIDEVLVHIRKLRAVIDAAKARDKASEPAQPHATDSRPDWCHIHNVSMKQRGSESQGYWHSHKATDGQWCRGKAKV